MTPKRKAVYDLIRRNPGRTVRELLEIAPTVGTRSALAKAIDGLHMKHLLVADGKHNRMTWRVK